MSGTKQGFAKAKQNYPQYFSKEHFKTIGAIGGRAGTGHAFAHGRISAREAGKLGGGNKRTRDEAWRERQSQAMKDYWAERRLKEQVFVPDSTDFGAGFFAPTRMQRVLNKIRSKQ